jgi:predicted metal-dependent peptidase
MNDSVTQAIVSLFQKEMFYAELITQMRRIINPELHAFAGVCIKDQIELHINPTMFSELPIEQRVAVLRHECEHILRGHIPRMKEAAPEVFEKNRDVVDQIINGQKFKILNISADCAINGNMQDFPKCGVFPKNFDLPNGETFEWYLNALKDNEKMKYMTEFDGHELWAESDTKDKEVLKEKIRQAVTKAAKRTRAAGRMTAENELLIENLNPPTISWQQQLKRFVAHSMTSHVEESRKKRNRRYGIVFPGQIKIEDLHIGVAADSSGSVSNEAYTQFISEIQDIAKYAKVTFIDADCEVKEARVWKKSDAKTRKGSGGTAYQPAFDYFNKIKDLDAVLYFGDMDSSDTPKKPKYPVLWCVIGDQTPPGNFGSCIEVKIK